MDFPGSEHAPPAPLHESFESPPPPSKYQIINVFKKGNYSI